MLREPANADKYLPTLLRGIRDDLVNYVLPELTSGDAKEHVEFARLVLDRYTAEIEMRDQVCTSYYNEFVALVAEINLALNQKMPVATTSRNLDIVRAQLATTIHDLTLLANQGTEQAKISANLITKILALETRLKQAIGAAQQAARYQPVARKEGDTARMSLDNLNAYLKRKFPALPAQPVATLRVLPGGRSKTTVFVTLKPNNVLPNELVVRQDMPGGPVDTADGVTHVAHEYPVLSALVALTDKGLPIATPVLLEKENSECGHPFMMVKRLPGVAPGTFFGFSNPKDPALISVAHDLARVMARLHSVDLTRCGLSADLSQTPEDRLRREVEYRWNKWRRDAVEPSPIFECALARLHAECKPGLGGPALVHGDIAPHNILVLDGKVSALLDWEFVHIGDPAQDLAYCRASIEQIMPWQEFMDAYVEAGGERISERRLTIFGLVGLVRNTSFCATAGRVFLNKESSDFTTGASGYFPTQILEPQIAALLNALDQY